MGDLPGVVLAGGRSSRLGGGDKGLRLLAGQPMLARVVARMAAQCAPLALNANGDPARFAATGLAILPDPVAGQPGPLAGVLAAMDWAAGLGAAQVVTVAVDTPFLPEDLVERLAAAGEFALAASPDGAGAVRSHPVCGLWPVALRDRLRADLLAGERRVGRWAAARGAVPVVWPGGAADPFRNINTPEDLAAAERHIDGASPR